MIASDRVGIACSEKDLRRGSATARHRSNDLLKVVKIKCLRPANVIPVCRNIGGHAVFINDKVSAISVTSLMVGANAGPEQAKHRVSIFYQRRGFHASRCGSAPDVAHGDTRPWLPLVDLNTAYVVCASSGR